MAAEFADELRTDDLEALTRLGVAAVGWVKPRPGPRGQQFTAVYRDLKGAERSAGTYATRREASKAWQRAEAEQDVGRRSGDPRRGEQRFAAYVEVEWFPNHRLEATAREGYAQQLRKHVLPEFGAMRLKAIRPVDVRRWVKKMEEAGVGAPTIEKVKTVFDAIFTTALNDEIVAMHPGKGVKTPPAPRKNKTGMTVAEFEEILSALPAEGDARMLVETDIETGLRWGELTELRVKDLDRGKRLLRIQRVVVHLKAANRPEGVSFLVKDYPKDEEHRIVKVGDKFLARLVKHIEDNALGPDDLLFSVKRLANVDAPAPRPELPDPATLGQTDANAKGHRYHHGTLSAYQLGECRCQFCRNAVAAYRTARRDKGLDGGHKSRRLQMDRDGHIGNDWFRKHTWAKTLKALDRTGSYTPNDMRHAHASWLLAGGADLQQVRERLGHGSIRTTERYLHALENSQDDAVTALEATRTKVAATNSRRDAMLEDPPTMSGTEIEELSRLRTMVGQLQSLLGVENA